MVFEGILFFEFRYWISVKISMRKPSGGVSDLADAHWINDHLA